jgi:hypothetical protein
MEGDSAVNVVRKLPLNWFGSVGYPDVPGGSADEDFILYDSDGNAVASLIGDARSRKDWASFIVLACNGHHALLEACRAAFNFVDDEGNNKDIVHMPGSFGLWETLKDAQVLAGKGNH